MALQTEPDKHDLRKIEGAKFWRHPDMATGANNNLKECWQNVALYVQHCPGWEGVLGVDEFARKIVVRKPSPLGEQPGQIWTAQSTQELGAWLSRVQGLTIKSIEQIELGVTHAASRNPFHPVREFLEALEWDGTKRLDTWAADYLAAPAGEYSGLVGRYFLLNMVRRIFEPGCIMRSVPVLEGPQNRGKSRSLYTLAQPWFADTPLQVNNKDAFLNIQGIWLYEIAELDSFHKAETTAVKAFVSSVKDRFRTPYGRNVEDQPRQTMFAATTNAREYLKDWTGATRFWPLVVGERDIDLEGLAGVRDQLFAEAVAIYRAGGEEARAYPSHEIEDRLFKPEQERRTVSHPWFDVIDDYLERNSQIDEITVRALLETAIGMEPREMGRDQQASTRVGMIMAKLGWEKGRQPTGARLHFWRRPKPPKPDPSTLPEAPF